MLERHIVLTYEKKSENVHSQHYLKRWHVKEVMGCLGSKGWKSAPS